MLSDGIIGHPPSSTSLGEEAAAPARMLRAPIRLAVTGRDLVLDGRFNHWLPLAAEHGEGEGAVQMMFDATGLAQDGAGAPAEENLFAFRASLVDRISPLAVVARGQLRHDDVEVPAEALIQSPAAHSPFFAVTFSFGRDQVPELWVILEALVGGSAAGAQLSPSGWLRHPTLAVA